MPKPKPDPFFVAPQAAAVLKHAILSRQLEPWASKVGSVGDGHVAYLDTHAGAGSYETGDPGSPLLAASMSVKLAAYPNRPRELECFYIEPDPEMAARLREVMKKIDHPHEVLESTIERCLDEILDRIGTIPLFVFSDPFGLGLTFDTIRTKVLARSGKTDLLLNFSLNAMRRVAGLANSMGKSDRTTAMREKARARLNVALGSDTWLETWKRGHPSTQHRDHDIVLDYVKRLAGGRAWAMIPASDRVAGAPVYYLVFITGHIDGLWLMGNSLSSALEDYEDWCADQKPATDAAQLELDLEFPTPHDALAERGQEMIEAIAKVIDGALGDKKELTISRELTGSGVLSEFWGRARETHIRKALDRLYAGNRISTSPRGVRSLQHFTVRR